MNSKIILVQDFDVPRRTQICHGLSLSGHQTLEAINSQHAEIICYEKGNEIDLIIATPESRSDSEWRQLCPRAQLIGLPALSAKSGDAVVEHPRLQEPFSFERLRLQVQSVLGCKLKILVIDDDRSFRTEIASGLRRSGYVVGEVRSSEALALFSEAQPEAVITEISMSGQEGLELISKLRELKASLTIIATTGGPRANTYLRTARLLGANETLKKPFLPDELLRILARIAERRTAQQC